MALKRRMRKALGLTERDHYQQAERWIGSAERRVAEAERSMAANDCSDVLTQIRHGSEDVGAAREHAEAAPETYRRDLMRRISRLDGRIDNLLYDFDHKAAAGRCRWFGK